MKQQPLPYRVATLRSAGLEAKWSKNRAGTPILVARDPNSKLEHQRTKWWFVGERMWDRAAEVGPLQAFNEETLLGDIFSLPTA